MRYCPQCATPLEQRHVAGRERPVCPACGFVWYRNPVPIVVVNAVMDGRLVLVRRLAAPLEGYWAQPGGYVEYDETLEEALVREVKEETNLDVVVEDLAGVFSRANTGVIMVAYWGRVVGGEPRPGEDAGEVGLFAPHELPVQPPPPASETLFGRWAYEVITTLMEEFRRHGR